MSRSPPLWRYLPLVAFLALLAAPVSVATTVSVGLALAVTLFRVGGSLARRARARAWFRRTRSRSGAISSEAVR